MNARAACASRRKVHVLTGLFVVLALTSVPGRAHAAQTIAAQSRPAATDPRPAATDPRPAASVPTAGADDWRGLGNALGLFGVAGLLGMVAYVLLAGATSEDSPAAEPAVGSKHASETAGGRDEEVLCSGCGTKLVSPDSRCPACGVSQELLCAACGAKCARTEEFCTACGAELAIGAKHGNVRLIDAENLIERMRRRGEEEEEDQQEE